MIVKGRISFYPVEFPAGTVVRIKKDKTIGVVSNWANCLCVDGRDGSFRMTSPINVEVLYYPDDF